jgi:hypothetical protein
MRELDSTKSEFSCLDSYEAEKLASIFSKQRDDTLFVSEIVKIIGSEVVVKLGDGSHHSIILKDEENAFQLSVFFKNLTQANGIISNTMFRGDTAIILWNNH